MWKTTTDGIQTMLTAASGASLGGKREAALDASDGWLGAAIRARFRQTVDGVTTTRYEATHATGMTRTGEKLVLPTASWTVVTNLATVRADGPIELVIEKASDPTVYFRFPGVALDKDLDGINPITFAVEITATNIYDAAAPTPPSSVAYTIYDNVNQPRPVSVAMLGMHFHRWPAATNPGDPSADPTYAFDATRVHDTEGTAWADVQVSSTGTDADFNWAKLDAVIDAHFAAGRKVMYCVHGCPQFLAALPSHPSPYGRPGYGSAPANWASLTRFVTALCTRYQGKLWAIQWWNEPDLGFFDYATGEGGTDRWIGTVTGNGTAATLQRRVDFAIGQKTLYQAANAVDASIRVYFGGFVFWTDTTGVQAQVQVLADTSIPSGGKCSDYADGLGFHFYGEATTVTAALNRFRSLEATRNAINPSWAIAMDEIGSVGSVSEAGHVHKIKQWALLAAGFGCDFLGLYSHEDAGTLGAPETNATVAAAIGDMHAALVGQSVVYAAVLEDGSVWVALADETEVQFPLTPSTPTGPYETIALPFKETSPWNEPIPGGASYPLDARTTQIRSTAQGVFGVNRVNWTINVFQAKPADPTVTLRVRDMFDPSDSYDVQLRWPSEAIPNGHNVSGITDHHLVILDPDGLHAHEMWYCYWQGDYWQTSAYCKSKISGTGWRLFPMSGRDPNEAAAGHGACRAVSVSLLGGLIRPGEVLSDGIDHALAFAVPRPWLKGATGSRVYPANTINYADGEWINGVYTPFPGPIPYSTRFGIPPSVNLDSLGLNQYYRRLAQALQTYGAYVVDVSGNPCFYSEWPGAVADGNAVMTSSAQMNAIMQQVRACDWI